MACCLDKAATAQLGQEDSTGCDICFCRYDLTESEEKIVRQGLVELTFGATIHVVDS
jgi:hypothetical protein